MWDLFYGPYTREQALILLHEIRPSALNFVQHALLRVDLRSVRGPFKGELRSNSPGRGVGICTYVRNEKEKQIRAMLRPKADS